MKKYLSLILLLSNALIFSQVNQSHEEYMKRVFNSSQTPNAFTFSDYSKEGNVDVSTGRFGINIPFTAIENQYASLPISLSYSTSGVKVDENASEIGMGWNLIAGGQITRKLNGGADDLNVGPWDANLFVERRPPTGGQVIFVEGWTSQFSAYSMKSKSNGSAKIIFDDIIEYGMGQLQAYNEFYSKYFSQPRINHSVAPSISDNPMTSITDMINNPAGVETQRDVFHVSVGDLDFHFILKLKDELLNQVDLTHHARLPYTSGAFDPETNYEAVALDDNDIKIDIIRGIGDNYFYKWVGGTRQRLNTEKRFFKGFIVTDKSGVKYYFDNYLFTEPEHIRILWNNSDSSTNGQRFIQGLMQDVQINNWVLSKIIFPNNETIEYDYLKKRITEQKIVPREHDGEYTGHPYNLRPPKTTYGYNTMNYEYEKLYVERIKSRNKTIEFNYDESPRVDLQNGRRLQNIQLFDFNHLLIKQWDLISEYKGSGPANNYLSKRLFLSKLIEKSITDRQNIQYDNSKNAEYIFDYYNPDKLPSKNAVGFEDLYGYYLGNTVENEYPPFPKLYINPNDEGNKISYYPITSPNSITFNGAERRPNSNTVNYGALKEIKFPTRGRLEIEYEPNQFYSTSTVQSNLNGPGCRVENLKYYSGQNTLVKNKRYTYESFDTQGTSSGVLLYKPSYAYISNYVNDNSKDMSVFENQQNASSSDDLFILFYNYTTTKEVLNQNGITDLTALYKKLITTSTHPIGPQSDCFGRDMIYTNVTEEDVSIDDNTLTNGKTKYYNYYTDNRTEVNVMSGPTDEFTYIPPCSSWVVSKPGYYSPDDPYNSIPATYPWKYGSSNNIIKVKYGFIEKKGKDIFPFPERNYFNNNDALKIGKTYKIEYVNNSNSKVQEKKYTYSRIDNTSYKTLNFNINYKDTYCHWADDSNNRFIWGAASAFKSGLYFYTIDELYTKQKLVLEKEEVINYQTNGSITNTTQNYFNNSFLINRISKMSSEQIIQDDLFYYPNDYSQGEDINNLNVKNRISEVIKYESRVGNEIVKSSISRFIENPVSDGNPFFVRNKIYSKKGDLDILGLSDDDLNVTYEKYDNLGNLLQYSVKGNATVVILWGYNKSLPIAKIENITYEQVQSYESNLQSLSNTGTEANLRNALNDLRNSFPNAMVTTYTHKPLIGVSTLTDVKGNTIFYTYDELNRLKCIKDKNGNVLSENQYHYKN